MRKFAYTVDLPNALSALVPCDQKCVSNRLNAALVASGFRIGSRCLTGLLYLPIKGLKLGGRMQENAGE